ncbi:EF-hand domain-containing protein [Pseudodesulfovibrio sediminis]|uniref:EF-hand domain-containing protein n=1 Tax=Pseudodesulfovibrio sediminis TaxID=2810563 RepID=A0ABN6ESB4_9BACT|nr:EF-hand domain-containing protein [Pseudodesulfovibrio sediminis]BCS87954.1 hypothetical protein PSDVSF_11960 [Pseudodesulfovibrio sediminis]
MSISAIGSGSALGQMTGLSRSEKPSSDDIAASIFERDDADGDGLLNLDETPLDEERFNSIDTDGDGFITAKELTADIEANMAEGMPVAPPGAQEQAATATGSGSADSSSSSENEEEYDTYDLNEDGVVTLDELLQAFQSGDSSLKSVFESLGDGAVSSMTTRLAMEAYQAQMG